MIRSTFGSFMTARLAMTASQQALNVTGQNIANINTTGYTRQRLDLVSFNTSSSSMRYASPYTNIGNGVKVAGVSQIRDPFLDIRFRNEMSNVGQSDATLGILKELQGIFDEIGKVDTGGGIHNQMADMLDKLNKLAQNPNNKEFDSMVKSSAEVLTTLFNLAGTELETLKTQYETDLTDVEIPNINNILKSIQELNIAIKQGQINGHDSLELKDQRNLLIDELSTYVKLDIKYTPVQISKDTAIEELRIQMVAKDGTKVTLIDDARRAELATEKNANGDWNINIISATNQVGQKEDMDKVNQLLADINTANQAGQTAHRDIMVKTLQQYMKVSVTNTDPTDPTTFELNLVQDDGTRVPLVSGATNTIANIAPDANGNPILTDATGTAVALNAPATDIISSGSLKGMLNMLNGAGEFDPAPNSPRGFGYYEGLLNTLASKLATEFNNANNLVGTGTPLTGHDLFGTNDGTTTITAKNIAIASGWANNTYGVTASKDPTAPAGDNTNINHMIALMSKSLDFTTTVTKADGTTETRTLFKGTFQESFTNIGNTLGLHIKSTTEMLNNYSTLASEIGDSRENMSGVNLDDEGMNMLQYQKSYNAAARFMTVLDEAVDTIINRMGVVGR